MADNFLNGKYKIKIVKIGNKFFLIGLVVESFSWKGIVNRVAIVTTSNSAYLIDIEF